MNVDQVMDGIGKAVAATKPTQEYCFLWIDHWSMCMTKSEWSGWMQAFGAVLALGIAIWAAGSYVRLEKRDAVVNARAFAKQLVVCAQGMAYGAHEATYGVFVLSIATLQELIAFGQTARPERLPATAMNSLLNLRLNAVALLTVAQAYRDRPSAMHAADFERLLSYYGGLVAHDAGVLHSSHNGVAAEKFDAQALAATFIAAASAIMKADATLKE